MPGAVNQVKASSLLVGQVAEESMRRDRPRKGCELSDANDARIDCLIATLRRRQHRAGGFDAVGKLAGLEDRREHLFARILFGRIRRKRAWLHPHLDRLVEMVANLRERPVARAIVPASQAIDLEHDGLFVWKRDFDASGGFGSRVAHGSTTNNLTA